MIFGELHQTIRQAYRKAFSAEPPRFVIEPARHKMFGDFSSNVALLCAAQQGGSAVAIAQKIVQELEGSKIFRNVSVTTPGFINFTITDSHLLEVVGEIIRYPEAFGRSDLGKEIRVLIEFVSANPTGPLTLSNGREAFVGETIARVLELYGCAVAREYFVSDRGDQITSLGHAVLKDKPSEFKGAYINELSKRIKETKPDEAGGKAAVMILEESIKPTLKKAGIDFRQFFSERSLYQTGVFKRTLELLKVKGLVYEAEGATWLSTTRYGDSEDRVLISAAGVETYFASDIAYHSFKLQRGYHRLINVSGVEGATFSKQLNLVLEGVLRGEYTWGGQVDWAITQPVSLVQKGQAVKPSKLTGTYLTLQEVIEAVGLDVARFFLISRDITTPLEIDLDVAKSNSLSNPVFYLQYAYARISSIFREYSKNGEFAVPETIVLTHPIERQLLLRILQFPDLVEEVVGDLMVHKLANYATLLATDLHSFYENLKIVGERPEVTLSRLAILKASSITLKRVLDLTGISAPSRMMRSPKA